VSQRNDRIYAHRYPSRNVAGGNGYKSQQDCYTNKRDGIGRVNAKNHFGHEPRQTERCTNSDSDTDKCDSYTFA
jgi:hypothetical protein